MAGIIPDSTFYLLKDIDLDSDYEYTMDFNTLAEQKAYFDEHIASELPKGEYSYIRTNDTINIFAPIESIIGLNYCMFTNNDKTYYAFIMAKEYVSENVTRLRLKIDAFQTFMFDYELKESFVDREHQDRFKKQGTLTIPRYNLKPENLEIGADYDCKKGYKIPSDYSKWYSVGKPKKEYWYLILSKEPLGKIYLPNRNEYSTDYFATLINGLSSNVFAYIVSPYHLSVEDNTGKGYAGTLFGYEARDLTQNPLVISIRKIQHAPQGMELKGVVNGIYEDPLIEIPCDTLVYNPNFYEKVTLSSSGEATGDDTGSLIMKIKNLDAQQWCKFRIDNGVEYAVPSSIEDKKNILCETKLLTSPFSFLRVNQGTEHKDFKHELFYYGESEEPKYFDFDLIRSTSVNGKDIIKPTHYISEKTSMAGENFYPNLSNDLTLRTDAWQEYELNNKASLNGGLIVQAAQFVGSVGLGLATGGTGLAVAGQQAISFAGSIANEMLRRQDIKNQPDQIRPASMDTLSMSMAEPNEFTFGYMEIQEQFKKSIFDYFTHYGYKADDFKKPETRSRYYYNYIKTIGVNIKAGFDKQWQDEIKAIYNRGTTIWHYRDKATMKGINNYDYENVEMTLLGS